MARRIEASYARFLNSDRLDAEKTSAVYALFTDTQTYFDQRSYAYVRRSLDDIDAVLEA